MKRKRKREQRREKERGQEGRGEQTREGILVPLSPHCLLVARVPSE